MALHRSHVTRFISVANVPAADGEKMKSRAENAIAQFGSLGEGMFAEARLSEVIGDAVLLVKFDELWKKGELRP